MLQIEARLIMANALYRLGNYQKATRYLRSNFIIIMIEIEQNMLDDSMKARFYYIYSELLLLVAKQSDME